MADLGAKAAPPPPPVVLAKLGVEAKVYEVKGQDQAIAGGLKDDALRSFEQACRDILELNGSGEIPGQTASFIAESEYVHNFDQLNISDGAKKLLFLAYNWVALKKGLGGLCGSAIRWALRDKFDPNREMKIHTTMPADSQAVISEFNAASGPKKAIINFFMTNAISIVALAGAQMNKIMHHWDANHTAPQKAFISAMGVQDQVPEEAFRAIFYLAVHPIPLAMSEQIRASAALGLQTEVAEVVRLRCYGPPAGFGALNACAAAGTSLLTEPCLDEATFVPKAEIHPDAEAADYEVQARAAREVETHNMMVARKRQSVPKLRAEITQLVKFNKHLCEHASHFHQFATKYGHAKREIVDQEIFLRAMIITCGYIYSKVKGSLAESAALKKFRNSHQRQVQRVINAFNEMSQSETIEEVLGI